MDGVEHDVGGVVEHDQRQPVGAGHRRRIVASGGERLADERAAAEVQEAEAAGRADLSLRAGRAFDAGGAGRAAQAGEAAQALGSLRPGMDRRGPGALCAGWARRRRSAAPTPGTSRLCRAERACRPSASSRPRYFPDLARRSSRRARPWSRSARLRPAERRHAEDGNEAGRWRQARWAGSDEPSPSGYRPPPRPRFSAAAGSSSATSTPADQPPASRGSKRPAPSSSVEAAPAATAARSASSTARRSSRAARKPASSDVARADRRDGLEPGRARAVAVQLALLPQQPAAAVSRVISTLRAPSSAIASSADRRSPRRRGTPGRRGLGLALVRRDEERLGLDAEPQRLALASRARVSTPRRFRSRIASA